MLTLPYELLINKGMAERKCIECEMKLAGRRDQKFCSDYCRNTYNILRKNRRILASLNPNGKKTVDGITLAEEGFNFHYYTNVYTTRTGSTYYFCYEQGYLKMDDDKYMLVLKQDYVK